MIIVTNTRLHATGSAWDDDGAENSYYGCLNERVSIKRIICGEKEKNKNKKTQTILTRQPQRKCAHREERCNRGCL